MSPRVLTLTHEGFQSRPLPGVDIEHHAQGESGIPHEAEGSRLLRRLQQELTLHCERVEPAFGQWLGVCACGVRSLAIETAALAFTWRCPFYEAAVESEKAERRWLERISDATMNGVRR